MPCVAARRIVICVDIEGFVYMLFHWELFLQWCLYTVEVTAGVFHKVFHQVLQLLFILSWKLALRPFQDIEEEDISFTYLLFCSINSERRFAF